MNFKRKAKKIVLGLSLIAVWMVCLLTFNSKVYAASYSGFIEDPAHAHGAPWQSTNSRAGIKGETPKISKYDCYSCMAYVADFAAYMYGHYGNPRELGITYSDISQIQGGDIIYGIYGGSDHYIAVLERDGDKLYTAEGSLHFNEGDYGYVYVGWRYTISGDSLIDNVGKYTRFVNGFRSNQSVSPQLTPVPTSNPTPTPTPVPTSNPTPTPIPTATVQPEESNSPCKVGNRIFMGRAVDYKIGAIDDSMEPGFHVRGNNIYYYSSGGYRYSTIPRQWRIIRDEGDTLLLLQEYIYEGHNWDDSKSCSWEESGMRQWLNGLFYDRYFSDEEKQAIVTSFISNTAVGNPLVGDAGTRDYFFLPSADEMDAMFSSDAQRVARYFDIIRPEIGGPAVNVLDTSDYSCAYYTRTPSNLNYGMLRASHVNCRGQIGTISNVYFNWSMGVRPMVRVKKAAVLDRCFSPDNFTIEIGDVVTEDKEYCEYPVIINNGDYKYNPHFDIISDREVGILGKYKSKHSIYGLLIDKSIKCESYMYGVAKPNDFKAKISENTYEYAIDLTWSTKERYRFEIYRSERADGAFQLIHTGSVSAEYEPLVRSDYKYYYTYKDTNIVEGKTYYYKVRVLFPFSGDYVNQIDGITNDFSDVASEFSGGIAAGPDGKYYLYNRGRVLSEFTGTYIDANFGWWYIENGCINYSKDGYYKDSKYGWLFIKGGAVAQSFTAVMEEKCGNDATCVLFDDGTLVVIGSGSIDRYVWYRYKNDVRSIVIDKGITRINSGGAFWDLNNVTSISLPDGLEYITGGAFSGCNSLSSIVIPDSVEEIGERAFYCTRLSTVNIPNQVKQRVDMSKAFYGTPWKANNIKLSGSESNSYNSYNWTIDNSVITITPTLDVESVGTGVPNEFRNTEGIKINISEGVRYIGREAFWGWNIERIVLPDSIVDIGYRAFTNCNNLRNIDAPCSCRGEDFEWSLYGVKDESIISIREHKYIPGTDICSVCSQDPSDIKEGLYNENGRWCLYIDGEIALYYTGVYYDETYGYWYVENGYIDFTKNGLYCDDEYGWLFLTGGALDCAYNDMYYEPTIGWWKISNGTIDFAYNDVFCSPTLGWWKVAGGTIDFGYNDIFHSPTIGAWKISGGTIDFGYNDLYCSPTMGWWKVNAGALDLGYNDIYLSPTMGYWLVTGGMLDFAYDDIYLSPTMGYWKCKGGSIDFLYDDIFLSPTMGYWKCKGGSIDFFYDDIFCSPTIGFWKCKGGSIDFFYDGIFTSPTLGFWKCKGGSIDFGYVGVYNDALLGAWFISGGTIDFTYTGEAVTDGITYDVTGGYAIPRALGATPGESENQITQPESGTEGTETVPENADAEEVLDA